jgi:hypothetical protein
MPRAAMEFEASTYACPRLTRHNVRQLARFTKKLIVTQSRVTLFGTVGAHDSDLYMFICEDIYRRTACQYAADMRALGKRDTRRDQGR